MRCMGVRQLNRSVRKRAAGVLLVGGFATAVPGTLPPAQPSQCKPDRDLVRVAELPEASGIAVSRRVPGRLWAHNDSGQPTLVALDARGAVTGRLQISGAKVEDWEAIAVGPCGSNSCIYVADIGDNDANRQRVTIYRVPEPAAGEQSAAAEVVHASYPDGAHDAEALLATPEGNLFIVTKGETGPVGLYRFPREINAGATVKLEAVGQGTQPGRDGRITDGSMSPDGQWIVLRTLKYVTFHRAKELLAGNWREARRVPLDSLGEPQGEGVALAADNVLYVVGEGGGKSQAGTFARLTCNGAS